MILGKEGNLAMDIPQKMKAAVIDSFGGPEVLHAADIPVPKPGKNEILIRVNSAGVGVWDPWLRGGGAEVRNFPLVLGSDGAGLVMSVGSGVKRLKIGDRVYGYVFDNPKGGFYAEYAAIPEKCAAIIPDNIDPFEAGALAVSGITGLLGLDKLALKEGQTLVITGASGGVGHIALQLAKRMKVRVLAVASGNDGVELAKKLGADVAIDGHLPNPADAVKKAAPGGVDAVLLLSNSEDLEAILGITRKGARAAFPNGVEPVPKKRKDVKIVSYDGIPEPKVFERLNHLVRGGEFHVSIARPYSLEETGQAHEDVLKHHLGKLILKIRIA